jgi:hypothetical protein
MYADEGPGPHRERRAVAWTMDSLRPTLHATDRIDRRFKTRPIDERGNNIWPR